MDHTSLKIHFFSLIFYFPTDSDVHTFKIFNRLFLCVFLKMDTYYSFSTEVSTLKEQNILGVM